MKEKHLEEKAKEEFKKPLSEEIAEDYRQDPTPEEMDNAAVYADKIIEEIMGQAFSRNDLPLSVTAFHFYTWAIYVLDAVGFTRENLIERLNTHFFEKYGEEEEEEEELVEDEEEEEEVIKKKIDEVDLSDEVIASSMKYADELVEDAWEELHLREDVDFTSVMFSLFIYAIHFLSRCGYTKKNLIEEIHNHFEEEE